jgi:hypothetical protein
MTGFSEVINEETIQTRGIKGLLMKPISRYQLAKAVADALQ